MASRTKKTRNKQYLVEKLKIIDLLENGNIIENVARKYNINESSVRTIRDNKVTNI